MWHCFDKIKFFIENKLKLVEILLISMDLVLETLSAGLLIAANSVCGGKTMNQSSIKFNYCKLIKENIFFK